MKYTFHPDAKIELFTAIKYYEECSSGLGLDFSEEIYSSIQQIVKFPLAWSPISKNLRRCLTKRFPYGIIYTIHEDTILILVIMHLSKKPTYWHKRLRQSK